jgi:hypothetical protein
VAAAKKSKAPPKASKPAPADTAKKQPPRTTIPVEDDCFEPASRRNVTIPISDEWLLPERPSRRPKRED